MSEKSDRRWLVIWAHPDEQRSPVVFHDTDERERADEIAAGLNEIDGLTAEVVESPFYPPARLASTGEQS